MRASLTAYFTDWLGLTFGFRLLTMDVENGEYRFDGSLQGLFLGASIRF